MNLSAVRVTIGGLFNWIGGDITEQVIWGEALLVVRDSRDLEAGEPSTSISGEEKTCEQHRGARRGGGGGGGGGQVRQDDALHAHPW